ncbi:hypothetical protein [Streptomyces sp. NPDC002769]|uniref:hypothetical protein n=1 Tax=Streptomyces sp. NPDC002769 TaxID=3154542 RepID=UPI0033344C9C
MLQVLTDDELDRHPDPGSMLQSWRDAHENDGLRSSGNVYRAVLNSRHRTLHHLRQLPAEDVLTHKPQRCSAAPARAVREPAGTLDRPE